MEEIASGIVRWTARHPNLGVEVSSYLLVEEGVVLDPMVPPEGLDALREHGEVAHVVLAHDTPIIGDGADALRRLAQQP